ncbi:hypothetical protein PMAYCL1PPCAC_32279, partial [Pristionchus mayeri]
ILMCSHETENREKMKDLLYRKIITDELKLPNTGLGSNLVGLIEHKHPGATMEFVTEQLEKDPTSLPLRFKIMTIIEYLYDAKGTEQGTEADLSALHNLIRQHPSIAAENYDVIVKILETQYVKDGHAKKDIEFE